MENENDEIYWANVVERMVEEAGAKNERELDRIIDAPESYAYAMKKRGVSKGYLKKYVDGVPDGDLNYIYKGEHTQQKNTSRIDVTLARLEDIEEAINFDWLNNEIKGKRLSIRDYIDKNIHMLGNERDAGVLDEVVNLLDDLKDKITSINRYYSKKLEKSEFVD